MPYTHYPRLIATGNLLTSINANCEIYYCQFNIGSNGLRVLSACFPVPIHVTSSFDTISWLLPMNLIRSQDIIGIWSNIKVVAKMNVVRVAKHDIRSALIDLNLKKTKTMKTM